MRGRVVGGLAFVVGVGCAQPDAGLVVDLRTDLVPSIEFSAIRTTLTGPVGERGNATPVFASDDFVAGERIAELTGLPDGDYDLSTELLDPARRVVVSRTTHVSLHGTLALTVVVSRDCRGVTCPSASGDPTLTTCLGGACVDPRCSAEDRTFCPSGCTADTECTADSACALARCVEGTCLQIAGDTCGATERCDPESGCVPLVVRCDAPLRECGATCTNVEGDPGHCGDCTTTCTPPMHAQAECVAGHCGFVCDPGFHHCGDACTTDPCGASFTTAGTSSFEVPEGCTRLGVVAWGAGGGGAPSGSGLRPGAAGGLATATLAVTPGDVLTIVVGAPGADGRALGGNGFGGPGGEPGGGAGSDAGQHGGGGGGGYTGVFSDTPSQASALVIAGAGGGCGGAGRNDGAGGGYTGAAVVGSTGAPGTQTAGGIGTSGAGSGGALTGGAGARDSDGGGGGGAGWFGGAGSHGASSNAWGGGGGSGYVTPSAISFTLVTGLAGVPPSDADPRRAAAGDPGHAGAVLLTCE